MKFNFRDYQLEFIKKLTDIDANSDLNDTQIKEIRKIVGHECMFSFDENDWPTEKTFICESILDLIYDTLAELYAKFKLIKINGDEFTFIYNNADNENYGEFIANINTQEMIPIKYSENDKTGSDLLLLIRKDLFLSKLQKYKETRQIDGKTYIINCKKQI